MGDFRISAVLIAISRICVGLIFACLVSSCTSDNDRAQAESSDEVARAEDLINDGQYSEAIYVLSGKLAQPTPRIRVLLASAYTARAQIQLYSYRNLAAEIVAWNNRKDTPPLVSEDSPLNTAAKILLTIQFIIQSFNTVPIPQSEPAVQDLTMALKVLDDGGTMEGGATIFRALIRASLLKYKLLRRSQADTFSMGQGRDCISYLQEFNAMAQNIESDLYKLLSDIAGVLSNPEQRRRIHELAKNLQSAIANVNEFLAKATDAAKTSEAVLEFVQPSTPELNEICR